MGIISNNLIYGIKIYKFIQAESHILFECKYDTEMTYEMIIQTKSVYNSLLQPGLFFQVYTKCRRPYSNEEFMRWIPITESNYNKLVEPITTHKDLQNPKK